jgi:hypothetical protein
VHASIADVYDPRRPACPAFVSEDGLVVKFYGFTRRVISQMGRASQLVAKRWALINAGVDASACLAKCCARRRNRLVLSWRRERE